MLRISQILGSAVAAALLVGSICSEAYAYPSSASNSFYLPNVYGSCTWTMSTSTAHSGYSTLGLSGHMWVSARIACSLSTGAPYESGVEGQVLTEGPIGKFDSDFGHGDPYMWMYCGGPATANCGYDNAQADAQPGDYTIDHHMQVDLTQYAYYGNGAPFWTGSLPPGCVIDRYNQDSLDCHYLQHVTV